MRLPHKIDVDTLKRHDLEPFRTAVTRRLASCRAKESFKKDGFCSFPHRHCNGTKEASDPSQDTLEHHKKHFVRDFLTFHTSQLQNRRFPTSFVTARPQNRRFVRGFRRFSSHVTKCHACDGICTVSPLCAALTMRLAENTQHEAAR